MEINSAFNQGVIGFQNASTQIAQASVKISHATAQRDDQASTDRAPVSTELINMKVAQHQAIATANVIKTADDMVGSLIDTRV
ncbi:MAG: hypothetical protein KAH18_06180 [Psychromonas sp.]|nr:hypothetical protein [Psychromonas sp.]